MTILTFSRLISGLSGGMNTVLVPLYINEISPEEVSGLTGSLYTVAMSLGSFVSYLMGLGLPTDTDLSN